ncbi:ImmA/IrrE family metallo-endopeptidase [Streptomyces noursei]|uniref:ImmA/IrrE family metallo-endopeptidase n=1 Tax=Streptomyces noursei TaxID=1971 RepID=UPI0033FD2F9F
MAEVLTWVMQRRAVLTDHAERLRKELAEIEAEVARLGAAEEVLGQFIETGRTSRADIPEMDAELERVINVPCQIGMPTTLNRENGVTEDTLPAQVGRVTSTFDPEVELQRLGIPIRHAPLQGTLAAWDPEQGKVFCSISLSPIQKRCSLTHELAHIILKHQRCAYTGEGVASITSFTQERAAEMWAARKLINPVQLATARESGLSSADIARELGVTTRVYRARLLAEQYDEQRWLGTDFSDF